MDHPRIEPTNTARRPETAAASADSARPRPPGREAPREGFGAVLTRMKERAGTTERGRGASDGVPGAEHGLGLGLGLGQASAGARHGADDEHGELTEARGKTSRRGDDDENGPTPMEAPVPAAQLAFYARPEAPQDTARGAATSNPHAAMQAWASERDRLLTGLRVGRSARGAEVHLRLGGPGLAPMEVRLTRTAHGVAAEVRAEDAGAEAAEARMARALAKAGLDVT